ncbi:MAG: hypothetical protein R2727_09625 [Bacteroidales bacterium]
MRILVISDKSPRRDDSGGAMAVRSMISGLLSCGIEVDLLSVITPKHPSGDPPQNDKVLSRVSCHQVFINTGFRPVKLAMDLFFSPVPLIYAEFRSREMKKYIKKLLRENSYDLVQLEGLNLSPYIKTIRKNSRAKISFRAHNVESRIWEGLAGGNGGLPWRLLTGCSH